MIAHEGVSARTEVWAAVDDVPRAAPNGRPRRACDKLVDHLVCRAALSSRGVGGCAFWGRSEEPPPDLCWCGRQLPAASGGCGAMKALADGSVGLAFGKPPELRRPLGARPRTTLLLRSEPAVEL